jgi:DNA-binding beta-propeller fold protein YncE
LGSLGSALVGSAPVGDGPSELAINPATDTVYVTNGNNDNGPSAGGDTVSVIDTRHCSAWDVSRCPGPWPTITVGNQPSNIAVDEATDTVYVENWADATVSVFNGATCNALDTSGCGQKPATVPVGLDPTGIFVDDANHTVYVGNSDNGNGGPTTVSMINSARCNASDLATCPTTEPPTVNVGSPPADIVVDQATHTVYVATYAAITVFDADTCNSTVQSGCSDTGTLNGDPYSGPNGFEIDPANNTLYTANYDNTISAWDLADCNASDLALCASQTPGTVEPFPYSTVEAALWLAVDVPLHSVYVAYQRDAALVVVNTDVCNGADLAACAALSTPIAQTGAEPEAVALDEQTQTLYTANQADNDVSVIDASQCNAEVTSGCRQVPASVPVPAAGMVADAAVNTLYAAAPGNGVYMVNTQTCNSYAPAGCAATPPQLTVGTNPDAVAVDPLTGTVYVASFGSNTTPGPSTVSVIAAATCNSIDSVGCADVSTLQVPGGNAEAIAVDEATGTVYVGTITDSGPNLLSVFNGATCNAYDTTGCDQVPATLAFGDSGGAFGNSLVNLAVNGATNTVYATNIADYNSGNWTGVSIYVVNGAICDASDTSGCDQTPTTITPGNPGALGGLNPWGLAVDESTDTVYVALKANGDFDGTVAVINGATCNGSNTTGCGQLPPTVAASFGVGYVAVDPFTHAVYATNNEDASVSVINGTICNGLVSIGCDLVPPRLPAGNYPGQMALDPVVATGYVSNLEGVSVVPLGPPTVPDGTAP